MSRVLRRPMFRGGSTGMTGIMSGIQDRQNYDEGTPDPQVDPGRFKELVEELKPTIRESFTEYQKPTGFEDPLYQLAIQTGLGLMSRADSQNLLRNIAAETGRQTPQLFKSLAEEREKKRQYEQGIEGTAVGLAGDILGREISAAGKEKRDLVRESVMGKYMEQGLPAMVSQRAANFELDEADRLRAKVGGARDGGVIDFDLSKRDEVEANKKLLKQFDGKFVYDPFEGNYKRIEFIDGQPYFDEFDSIESIVLKTNKADTEEPEKDLSLPDFGMSIEDPIA
jgi:hypothetical protein